MSYQIQKGDTLSALARDNNTTVSALMELNPQVKDKDLIYTDKMLNLGTPTTSVQQSPSYNNTEGLAGTFVDNNPSDSTTFVNNLYPQAVKAAEQLGTAPENVLAQWVLETGWGKHTLPGSKNLGNIKAGSAWKGDTVGLNATEYKNGVEYKEPSRFRKYSTYEESAKDYANFLTNNNRYKGALGKTNPLEYFTALHNAGYATDPDYVAKVSAVVDSVKRRLNM